MAGNPNGSMNGVANPFNFSTQQMNPNKSPAVVNPMAETAKKFANINGMINAGANVVGTLGNAFSPNQYNRTVGMEKPNAVNQFTQLDATALGASMAGPYGAVAGLGVDVIKNALAYRNKQAQYNTAVNKQELYDGVRDRIDGMQPDFTGYARKGTVVNPMSGNSGTVEMEQNEIVLIKGEDGMYKKYMETGENAPTHEEGGVPAELPAGAIVFPGQYKEQIEQALEAGDTQAIEQMAEQMMQESEQAAQEGQPFSNAQQQPAPPQQMQQQAPPMQQSMPQEQMASAEQPMPENPMMPAMRYGGMIKPKKKC
jgi:hypothetical protein